MEQALYSEEGITISSSAFVDNQPTLDLLEAKAVGIFGMIDSYQQRESKSLLEFAQIIHQNDKKITNEQLVDCALAAETPKNIENLPENHIVYQETLHNIIVIRILIRHHNCIAILTFNEKGLPILYSF
jgi:hypothetical protein